MILCQNAPSIQMSVRIMPKQQIPPTHLDFLDMNDPVKTLLLKMTSERMKKFELHIVTNSPAKSVIVVASYNEDI